MAQIIAWFTDAHRRLFFPPSRLAERRLELLDGGHALLESRLGCFDIPMLIMPLL